MNNTHIIIPIKDIEDKIKWLNLDIKVSERGGDNIRAAAITHLISGIEEVKKLGKRISLDEKNIENKGKTEYYKYHNWSNEEQQRESIIDMCNTSGFLQGYKQALKDLL